MFAQCLGLLFPSLLDPRSSKQIEGAQQVGMEHHRAGDSNSAKGCSMPYSVTSATKIERRYSLRGLATFCLGNCWEMACSWEVVSDCLCIASFVLFSFSIPPLLIKQFLSWPTSFLLLFFLSSFPVPVLWEWASGCMVLCCLLGLTHNSDLKIGDFIIHLVLSGTFIIMNRQQYSHLLTSNIFTSAPYNKLSLIALHLTVHCQCACYQSGLNTIKKPNQNKTPPQITNQVLTSVNSAPLFVRNRTYWAFSWIINPSAPRNQKKLSNSLL